jgi:hypothetical protein
MDDMVEWTMVKEREVLVTSLYQGEIKMVCPAPFLLMVECLYIVPHTSRLGSRNYDHDKG